MIADVDILIVNYATPALTRQATERLRTAGRILVWDNSDELRDSELNGAELYGVGRNILYAAASNALYRHSEAPIVLLLNADALAGPQDVAALADALVDRGDAWAAAPRLTDYNGQDQRYRRRLPTVSSMLADRVPPLRPLLHSAYQHLYCVDLDPSELGYVEQPAAACLAIRRDVVGPVLFDERYPLFGNDLDLAKRMADRGYHALYLGEVAVRHVGGASIDVARRRDPTWVRNEYDRALRTYSRDYLRLWPVLEPVFAIRLFAHRVTRIARGHG